MRLAERNHGHQRNCRFLLCHSKRPQEIDEAARRRLVKRLYIPLPGAPARKQIVLNLMKQQPFSLSEDEMENICLKSEGMYDPI